MVIAVLLFAFTVNTAQTLSQLALITSIAVVMVPAAWWVVRKIQGSVRVQIAEQNDQRIADDRLGQFEMTLTRLNEALLDHMSSEDVTNKRIEQLGRDLIYRLESLETSVKHNQVHMMKALAASDTVPTMLYEVEHGENRLLWANRAYLQLVGLSLSEAIGGGVWLTIDESEREIIRAAAEAQAQMREDYVGEYTLVNPKTHTLIGKVYAEGNYIAGSRPDTWFYLNTVQLM